jgi:SAM-dependent methyltransferase
MKATIKKFVPKAIKRYIRKELRSATARTLPRDAIFIPFGGDSDSYTLPAYPKSEAEISARVPPRDMWVSYGATDAEHLESGRRDVVSMCQILEKAGTPIERMERILEIGCASGRMIRHLDNLAPSREIWGVDFAAAAVMWCEENLSPPFHFATTTVVPHLPFKDEYFDLVYAGSVFTHIDELANAWFLELRRILKPGGKLWFTINDRRSIKVFEGERTAAEFEYYCTRVGGKQNWLHCVDGLLRQHPAYRRFVNKEVDMVVMGRPGEASVLWDADVLCKRLEPFWQTLSVTEKAYGHQTAILLQSR